MWLALHFWTWIILTLLVIGGLTRHSEKRATQFLILARLAYLVMIISGVVLSIRTFGHAPVLISLKFILGIGTIALIEISFGRKMERDTPHLVYWILGLVALLTVGLGLTLAFH
ncbi:MAG: DUF1516 family protein [Levilactobacillus sp.]|jgi:hypothetical protein|uniref:DUF1516 family protein n=1 Tax=Levilactobacillus suantsaiihabitans TaxID=2487722 RepID=A0A4Z0J863_9LACO|nr:MULTISPECIES: DUF1516 family protein [Levilactobacillus]MCH4123057.1 DUF1516 family protein [Levilactobacillus sp.]MCI1552805.1 DUF1516 family protein [Levilactobacillus sp.]MCI1598894.1 DUF1516 family protein [Levilactobacillus sp.]MCI1605511.1 DUF1516 family protein [Levilactobacillus sp.]TGD18097.1 DUF1516 family protein [Levilactobacillus suantsaiihabitans]